MARRVYSDEDKAVGLLHLTLTDGNIMRAARDTGYPESTIRRWKGEWDREGIPLPIQAAAEQESGAFVDEAIRVRDKSLKLLETKIEKGEGNVVQLTTVVGVLDDKIMRARGLANMSTIRVQHELPSPEEIRDTLVAAMSGMLEATKQRHDIIDAEVVDIKELGPVP